ncbi:N-acetyl-D-Glu racemase DgcA [Roseateles toxinivorans]|uniref:Dipeptide epimerase n=1 Tax=Roseateles toxinivorans TaxID=270368 RepID=A0A4R6QQM2_9BURK|nr:N-acetyl-D-Glu racemase DgcA [Roseateles toxinivorans]TDP73027.1 L-alanine-DL-glutamate epimerase-like enolase superfamily enzyme [Roseateles toxinivorans]
MTLELQIATECLPLSEPLEIACGVLASIDVIVVTLRDARGHSGRGEAAGVDYAGESLVSMTAQLAAIAPKLHAETSAAELMQWLPAGGARNALDCALWDLRAKQSGQRAWTLAGFRTVLPVTTAYTIGLGKEADVRRKARAARHMPLIKIKADAIRHLDMVRFVKEEHPGARLVIDANQAWDRDLLEQLLPELYALGVELIEQPVRMGEDAQLDGLRSPIPLAADESCTDRSSLPDLLGRYQYINIKLDKCGGLSEGLALVKAAQELGFGLMVGCMGGSSLAMAPAFLVAQDCSYVDLDGPLLLAADRPEAMAYASAQLSPPEVALWG